MDLGTRADSDEGFGLVEIVVSMFILALLSLALLPLLIQGVKQSAATATVATASQLVNKELDLVRKTAVCSSHTALTTTATDSRGVPLRIVRTVDACPTVFPGTVAVHWVVTRTDTSKTVTTLDARIFVTS